MTTTNELAKVRAGDVVRRAPSAPLEFDAAQRQIIRDTFANGASDSEFAVLMAIAETRRLNPFLKQIYFVSRFDKQKNRKVWATQVGIDGLRAIAERTGLYDGQDEPEFEYVTNDKGKFVVRARVKVWRKDWSRPAVGVAYYDEYVQRGNDGPMKFWDQMPHNQLAKCAESLALRKAFPEDMSGLYTPEEMGQADNPERVQIEQGEMREIGGGGNDVPEGLAHLFDALDSFGDTCTQGQAVQLVRDHCSMYARAPKVAVEDGATAQDEIMRRTVPPFASARALGLAVRHAEACDAHSLYKTLTTDFAMVCKTPVDVVTAWKMTAADVGWTKLPDEVRELARMRAAGAIQRLDPSIKQGGAWLAKQLGPDAPKPPTRGPSGRNATGDHAKSEHDGAGIGFGAGGSGAAQASADPERDAIQSESAEKTPAEWAAHLAKHENPIAVANSWAKHAPSFGRTPSVFRGVAIDRLRALGLSDAAAADAIDGAVKARNSRTEKAA